MEKGRPRPRRQKDVAGLSFETAKTPRKSVDESLRTET